MPLNNKGKKILKAFQDEYGKEQGTRFFYASEQLGKFSKIKRHKPKKRKRK
jgi:hypothetical protein